MTNFTPRDRFEYLLLKRLVKQAARAELGPDARRDAELATLDQQIAAAKLDVNVRDAR